MKTGLKEAEGTVSANFSDQRGCSNKSENNTNTKVLKERKAQDS